MSAAEDGETAFAARDAKRHARHLDGRLRPVEAKQRNARRKAR
jgi:hypothetical protein